MFWISLLVLAKLKFQVWLNSDMFELRYRVSVRLGSARLGLAQFLLKLFGKKAQLCMSCLTHWQELQEATLAISYKVVT